MNAQELAARLNGRSIGAEITREEEALAKQHGLVVVFGASDDLCELRGAIHDEVGLYDGGNVVFTPTGLFDIDEEEANVLRKHGVWDKATENTREFEAIWTEDEDEPDWTYRVVFPHTTFDVIENDGSGPCVYCRGFVFSVDDAFRAPESEVSK